MAWFNFLKQKGYFNPEKNPEPVLGDKGYQIPLWEPLLYLEKLSNQIKEDENIGFIEEIIKIIKDVSENPKDNYRTWYLLIKILVNLPNENIPKEVLHYIPTWLSGKFDTMLQSSEISEKLLPKFLNDNPTTEDIEKAEIILQHLFEIHKQEVVDAQSWAGEGNSYYSRVYLHFLKDVLIQKSLVSKIALHCSNEIILQLGRNIKKMLLDYPNGIEDVIEEGDNEYDLKILIKEENLLVLSKSKNADNYLNTSVLQNFEDFSEISLQEELIRILNTQGLKVEKTKTNEKSISRIAYLLNNDLTTAFGFDSIDDLDDIYKHGEKVYKVFALIFRDILNEKAKQRPQEGLKLLNTIIYENNYRFPFFKRIAFYVIAQNWEEMKSIFWKLIEVEDPQNYFSNYVYQKELYQLLDKNQLLLTKQEQQLIDKIIKEVHSKNEFSEGQEIKENWQLRWYAALRNTELFKDKYSELSKKLDRTNHDYEKEGKLRIRRGSVSPLTFEEILEKSNEEIVNYIFTFKPNFPWEEFSVEGLGRALQVCVENNPEKIVEEIELYNEVYYIYVYHILGGLEKAWKNKKSFNWENVLNFCKRYILDEKFYLGQFNLENDDWNATNNWVVGATANLLSEGMRDDENAFSLELMPLAKQLITILVKNLDTVEELKNSNLNYPTYSLNSTAGKVLRALFDYSLRRARNLFQPEDTNKWENDVKLLFEETLNKGIIDGYILEGMYFHQFYYLDQEWFTEQVKNNYKLEDSKWLAFVGGLGFINSLFNKAVFKLMYPHYQRIIENELALTKTYDSNLIRHFAVFFLRGYDSIHSNGLIFNFLKKGNPKAIIEFVNFIHTQQDYFYSLEIPEREEVATAITDLWKFLLNQYQQVSTDDEKNIRLSLLNLMVFLPNLNDQNTELILKTTTSIEKNFFPRGLLEDLVFLSDKGESTVTAEHIGQILSTVSFNIYLMDEQKEQLIYLVEFIHKNGQSEKAAEICNKLSIQGHDFIRNLYNKLNL